MVELFSKISGLSEDKTSVDTLPSDYFKYKSDKNKPEIFGGVIKYFPRALEEISKVSAYGATKYEWDSWKKVHNAYERYTNALLRHIIKLITEGEYDKESLSDGVEILHDAQIAWNALARLELYLIQRQEQKN